ncbi:MAG: 16S rRNA (guanine(527)-N(7))-methyltransferase RsmG [Nitrospirae bacterium]|nr:16S rRNA (guanine(527)-N(7))-methyltransferase RsmG [Nitrospirota bacterium]
MDRKDRPRLGGLLVAGAKVLDCPLTDLQVDQFLIYFHELIEWNQRANLTAITDEDEIIEKHFLDSLAGLKAIDRQAGKALLDIGTGAGFPGLPLKIGFPEIPVSLLESSQKKAAFLYHIIGRLHLTGAVVLNQRVEKLAEQGRRYDWIVARAFAKKETVLEKALGLLAHDGKLILYQSGTEIAVPFQSQYESESVIPYELPFSKVPRRLEVFRRVS